MITVERLRVVIDDDNHPGYHVHAYDLIDMDADVKMQHHLHLRPNIQAADGQPSEPTHTAPLPLTTTIKGLLDLKTYTSMRRESASRIF